MLVIGNWKMNKTVAEARVFIKELLRERFNKICSVGITPNFVALHVVGELLEGSPIGFGAQNCYFEDQGAFTGEVSPLMLKDLGCKWCLVGHSERRHIFGETDELVRRKTVALLRHGIRPIVCVGETLEQRNSGKAISILSAQLSRALEGLDLGEEEFILAYEPVWAIGTGMVAKPPQIEEAHNFIIEHCKRMHPKTNFRVLYGGSVTPENCKEIAVNGVGGFLVGGASLLVEKFSSIIMSCD
ncbi:MAG TPA: triose-phosphate isomerase [Caldisericia bacterium]|nr:triose-phosphate isomerase [Caldisericia bacterium]HOU07481.1 triose-phosphate isomerase [Caldisericia bacterium]HPL89898.1 triose-phosphate isomerase [Caldisericia bacterium]HQG59262.1 triose-phosphate isomerase [Caldisericia bacterium]HQH48624.1 triose-phosphate isomerase [Caldisericia bacterium]